MKKLIVLALIFNSGKIFAQCWKTVCTGNAYGVNNIACAIKNDGSLWQWGNSTYRQLGDSAFAVNSLPELLDTSLSWQSVWLSASGFHILAQKKDGTLWGVGKNNYGELGNGTSNGTYVPVQIGTDADWNTVSLGEEFSIATRDDGTLWAWGLNYYGNLGDGTTVNKYVPTKIGLSSDWKYVSAGSISSFAIKSNGTLWAWGYNHLGQLGDGTTTDKIIPTQIGTDTDWQFVSGGSNHSLSIKNVTFGAGD